jgi:hypothetical protein
MDIVDYDLKINKKKGEEIKLNKNGFNFNII